MNKENAQKHNEASSPKEAMDIEKAAETHEGIPHTTKENSLDGDQRVEENTKKKAQNVDEETQEVAELLASNMSREEPTQDEPMEFLIGFDLNIEDFNSDFNNEVFQDCQEITPPTAEEAQIVDQNAQGAEQNQLFADENIDQNAYNEPVMSADPMPLAS